ncbi:DUF4153 domain-containing protein [Rhizosphaericola mali]|uniref:DUF4153 domain-containing protein n=1 Tax=Rhizosphaericola mali TaxID=2545455 RepID=A0A5P2GEG2_9BACT|nr:DUF4153 domain-containing protein [Rhizosphaericola mali]QES90001.1 DUF4153 domain-containing protein [Rhizosphaericola mali]
MKFLSIRNIQKGLTNVIRRFPFELLIVLVAFITAILGIEANKNEEIYIRILVSCNIGLLLTLFVDILTEEANISGRKKWLFRLIAIGISIVLYYLLDISHYEINLYRVVAFSIAFHLLVALAPFLNKRGTSEDLWEYNKTIFLRILTSVLFSGVLYIGIALALSAIEKLWNVHVPSNTFFELFATIGILFNSLFFLAGVPTQFHLGEEKSAYPIGLKVFTQYILIPLMTLYMAILALYEIKIITQQVLPKGIVVWMVIGYAFFGILSLLLIYPIRKLQENKWIHTFSRIFYIVLIPFLVLLFIAIGIRIKHYGVTQERYSIVSIGIWLTLITVLLIIKPNTLKAIPATLCIFALVATYGPLSAPSISLRSQLNQLKSYIQNPKAKSNNPRSIVIYIVENFGMTALQSLTSTNLRQVDNVFLNKEKLDSNNYSRYTYQTEAVDTLVSILKIKKEANFYLNDYQTNYISLNRPSSNIIKTSGYDYLIDNLYDGITFNIDSQTFKFNRVNNNVTLAQNGILQFTISLNEYAKRVQALINENKIQIDATGNYNPNDSLLFIYKSNNKFNFTFWVNKFSYDSELLKQDEPQFMIFDADILIKNID